MALFRSFPFSCFFLSSLLVPFHLDALELKTAVVESIESPRVYRLDGVIEAVRQTTVSAQINGQVEDVLFDVDDYVGKGEVVVRLNDTQPRSRVKQAQAEMKEANARVEEAEEEYDRVKGVYEKKAVSKKTMDAAEAAKKAAQAKLEAARAGLEQAQEQLEYTRVRAPYPGIVTERHVEVGETAQPGKKLISGLSLEHLRVNVDVPQNMINEVRQAENVSIETADGSQVPVSKKTVFPYAEPASHTFRVRLEFSPDSQGLFPGMFVKAAFEIGHQPVLVVPTASVVRRSELTAVYILSAGGELSLRAIRKGRDLVDDNSIVLAGLQQGEKVVIDPVAASSQLKQQRSSTRPH